MSQHIHYTYIARCADGTFYTGYTTDPAHREKMHNAGKGAKYTRSRLPIKIIYSESFETKEEAMHREWEIKHLTRAEKELLVASKSLMEP